MTPLEEAVARVISGFDVGLGDDFRLVDALAHARKEKSLVNASAILDELSRAILALPEIVKMQEALEQCADRFAAFNKWQLNGRAGPVPQYEAAHTFARAALQPLKKEAE